MIALLMLVACGSPGPIEATPTAAPMEATPPAPVAPETPPADPTPAATPAVPAGFEACHPEWRAGGCTKEHKPTCGVTADGRVSTAANPCMACSDAATVGFKAGNCAE